MPRVHLPDGSIVNFPDAMSAEDINKALGEIHAPAKQDAAVAQPKEEKSVSGFLGNVASSGARYLGDTAKGIYDLGKTIYEGDKMLLTNPREALNRVATGVKNIPEVAPKIASIAGQAVKNRYGSIDAIKDTLYNDPVGVLGDVSAVAGGIGLASEASGALKIARIANTVNEATNPLRVLEPAAKAVEYGTAAAVRPMLKPSKALRRQGSALEIERTALKEGAVTERLAKAKQQAAAERATEAAADATTAVPKDRLLQMPKSLAKVEKGLSHEGDLGQLATLESDVASSLPDSVSASDLLDKRRYLDRELNNAFRAAERGGAPTGIKQAGQQEILGNVRSALREVAPNIREADDATRRLGLVRAALQDASLRAGDIPMGAVLLGSGLATGGIPGAGAIGAAFGLGRTFPQIPLAIGSVPVRAATALATPAAEKSMLLSAIIDRLRRGYETSR